MVRVHLCPPTRFKNVVQKMKEDRLLNSVLEKEWNKGILKIE